MIKTFEQIIFDDEDDEIWADNDSSVSVKTTPTSKAKTKIKAKKPQFGYILQYIDSGHYLTRTGRHDPNIYKAKIFTSLAMARNAGLGGWSEKKANDETKRRCSGKWNLIEIEIEIFGEQTLLF